MRMMVIAALVAANTPVKAWACPADAAKAAAYLSAGSPSRPGGTVAAKREYKGATMGMMLGKRPLSVTSEHHPVTGAISDLSVELSGSVLNNSQAMLAAVPGAKCPTANYCSLMANTTQLGALWMASLEKSPVGTRLKCLYRAVKL